jgi:hypothetical protein
MAMLHHTQPGVKKQAPTDFHLFGFLKQHLSGQWFVNDEDDDAVAAMT